MTTAQQHIHQQLEAQRWLAQQAAREQAANVAWLSALDRAGELFQAGQWADARRVLELAKEAR